MDDGFGNFIASCREYTFSRTHPDSEAKLWIFYYTETVLVLDVKVICHHNVHGIEIQVPSTSGDKTNVWFVMSRSSNRDVDELRQRESENLREEVAQECVHYQAKEYCKGKSQKTVFLFMKEFGRTCLPMNTSTDTSGKPKSRNLSVNWYDMSIREKGRQVGQFIGNSLVQSS